MSVALDYLSGLGVLGLFGLFGLLAALLDSIVSDTLFGAGRVLETTLE